MDEEWSTYLGASSLHVFCVNYRFEEGKPLLLFKRNEVYEKGTWLDIQKCSGVIDAKTFILLPNLECLSFTDCNIEKIIPNSLSSLKKLSSINTRKSKVPLPKEIFEQCSNLRSLSLADIQEPIGSETFIYLTGLNDLTLENCNFDSTENVFNGLTNLKMLILSNCNIKEITVDSFDCLQNLKYLHLRENNIKNFDTSSILKLNNLKGLNFHSNKIESNFDTSYYITFKNLPNLQEILFDTDIYMHLNFDEFKSLKNVQFSIQEEENEDVKSVIGMLEKRHIEYEFVHTGKIDFDVNDPNIQICC